MLRCGRAPCRTVEQSARREPAGVTFKINHEGSVRIAKAAKELRRLFERIEMSSDTYEFRAFTRLKQLRYLQRTGQINEDLFWSGM